ncbi:hypothetical protein CC1G_01337 [Coprinopsis cinerea okayama7|uniref:Uncharacterized protein n=1 Tax=Coprinopsis cinerea (strain Okayama-7 / 130 / ATCC MYA-4618 / FGSC 9003) TaxID=240176 RepID=A8NYG9_COPC7|nr:hypothetical protein CC1G_01337 [Coprinopsis cinerea okayama7\|eukprot:XP_001837425.2 hypothetical protein CC1G_01337 [Coprinopsis cinerea okayama7\
MLHSTKENGQSKRSSSTVFSEILWPSRHAGGRRTTIAHSSKDGDKNPPFTPHKPPHSKTVKKQRQPLSPHYPMVSVSIRRNPGAIGLLHASKSSGGRKGRATLASSIRCSEGFAAAANQQRIDAQVRRLYLSGSADQNIRPSLLLSQARQSISQEEDSIHCRKPFIMDVILDFKANLAESSGGAAVTAVTTTTATLPTEGGLTSTTVTGATCAPSTPTFMSPNGEVDCPQWVYYRTYDFTGCGGRSLESYWMDQEKIWQHSPPISIEQLEYTGAEGGDTCFRPSRFPISVERSTASWSPALIGRS